MFLGREVIPKPGLAQADLFFIVVHARNRSLGHARNRHSLLFLPSNASALLPCASGLLMFKMNVLVLSQARSRRRMCSPGLWRTGRRSRSRTRSLPGRCRRPSWPSHDRPLRSGSRRTIQKERKPSTCLYQHLQCPCAWGVGSVEGSDLWAQIWYASNQEYLFGTLKVWVAGKSSSGLKAFMHRTSPACKPPEPQTWVATSGCGLEHDLSLLGSVWLFDGRRGGHTIGARIFESFS